MQKKQYNDIIKKVPVDYYQQGVKNNLLQRIYHTNKLSQVQSLFPKYNRKTKLLDVGCASGWFLNEIVKNNPNTSGFGIDIYKEAIIYGKRKYPILKLRTSDAHKIPFPSKYFDVVICTEVLEHVDRPEIVLKEIKRVLKKNGTLIIELDSGSILYSIVWFFWTKTKGRVWSNSHLHSFDIKKLENHLKKIGLRIIVRKRFFLGMGMIFSAKK